MPPKAAASLTVIPRVPGRGRPEPPPHLDALESRIWREVIDALPSHWLDPAGQLILRRLAAQAAVSERQEEHLRQLRAQGQDNDEEAILLAAQHGVVAKVVAHLLTQLRATPRAQLRSRAAGRLRKCGRGRLGQVPRRKHQQPHLDKVTAADIIAFIEQTCFIPEGKFVGRPLKLFDWQKELLRLIYNNPQGTRRAIFSMGRKCAARLHCQLACSSPICAARRRAAGRTASFIPPRRAATRRASSSHWRRRWCV